MSRLPSLPKAADRRPWLAAALVAGALVLGGGGSDNPGTELALELWAALIALGWLLFPSGHASSTAWRTNPLIIVAALVVALPLLQLVPLPPALWSALPGRAPETASLALVGAQDTWRPLALSPPRTLAALLALGPPLLAMLMIAELDDRGRMLVIRTVMTLALASAVLGVAQLAGGTGALRPYPYDHADWLIGFQNNRNHEADVLLIGLVALAAAIVPTAEARASRNWLGWWAAGSALLLGAIVMTGSRAGIALIPLALVGQWLILRPVLAAGPLRSLPALAATAGAALAILAVVLRDNAALGAVAQRFAISGDFRSELWRDAWYALGEYWPAGAGMGAFVPVMLAAERLEVLDPTYPNRAHNDYLELGIEAGLPGLIVLLAIVAILGRMAIRKWRSPRNKGESAQLWLGINTLVTIALHSVVDYPLRTMALATLAGVAAGLLSRPPLRKGDQAT